MEISKDHGGRPITTPVRDAHRFDEKALLGYLQNRLPGFRDNIRVSQFKAGQSNPTFLIDADGARYVLRKKPPGTLLPSAHLIEREFRIMGALRETVVPVPTMRHLCEDASIIGTPFYVMDHVEGRVFQDPRLADLAPERRRAVYASMAETLAALHAVDWKALGLGDFGKPANYIERQIRLWSRQYEVSKTGEIAAMDRLMAWLPKHIPNEPETTIAHGDYRLGNLILHPSEPRVVAILDWELSTLGHPLSDLAYSCLPYHRPATSAVLPGLQGAALNELGIPDEATYLAHYFKARGRAPTETWPFYLAFAFFRLTSIVQGVYARALQGNASAHNAIEYGERAISYAELGWRQVERLG